jgi:hypothetical protein
MHKKEEEESIAKVKEVDKWREKKYKEYVYPFSWAYTRKFWL